MGRAAKIPGWPAVRLAILERDGWLCQNPACGRQGLMEVHHIRALEDGGDATAPANLQTLCRDCHLDKHRHRRVSPARAELLALVRDLK